MLWPRRSISLRDERVPSIFINDDERDLLLLTPSAVALPLNNVSALFISQLSPPPLSLSEGPSNSIKLRRI